MPMIHLTRSQAIQTKYQGPTTYKGSKIIAWAKAGKIYHDYDHSMDEPQNHEAAALALLIKLGWDNPSPGEVMTLVGGRLPNGDIAWIIKYEVRTLSAGSQPLPTSESISKALITKSPDLSTQP